jgi:hypothetical protein
MATVRKAVINAQERRTSPANSVYQFSMIQNNKNSYLPE